MIKMVCNSTNLGGLLKVLSPCLVRTKLRHQGLLRFQNGGASEKQNRRRLPNRPRVPKYLKNRGVFCSVTHDEMAFSMVISTYWQPCLFSRNLKPLFKRTFFLALKEHFNCSTAWSSPFNPENLCIILPDYRRIPCPRILISVFRFLHPAIVNK